MSSNLYLFDDLLDFNTVNEPIEFDNNVKPVRSQLVRLTNTNIYVRGKEWLSMPFDIYNVYSSKCGADANLRRMQGTADEPRAIDYKRACDAKYKQILTNNEYEESQYDEQDSMQYIKSDIWRNTYCCITCGTELTDDELISQALGHISYKDGDPMQMGWSTSETCTACVHNPH